MKAPQHLEYRALALLDSLLAGKSCSQVDAFSSAFAKWPVASHTTARFLAAQANAARGRDVLWLVGVAEDRGTGDSQKKSRVVGAQMTTFEAWSQALRLWFDGLAPHLRAFALPWDIAGQRSARQVIALLIETGRAPFVVRQQGKRPGLEVPWWDADAKEMRSAGRQELIKLLVPLQDLPQIEVLEAELTFYKNPHATSTSKTLHRWTLDGSLYLIPEAETRAVFPLHRCGASITFAANSFAITTRDLTFTADKQSPAIRITESAVLVEGLSRTFVYCSGSTSEAELLWRSPIEITFDLLPAGSDRTALATASLHPETLTESHQAGRWKL